MTCKNFSAVIPSPVGPLGIRVEQNKLTGIHFLSGKQAQQTGTETHTVQQELESYFKNPKHSFKLLFDFIKGTEFQKKVWHAISQIPSGTTATYKDLAEKLKTSPRAIGNACRTNPIVIVIPCHRVVGKNNLGGFSGETHEGGKLDIKKWLLKHEGSL